MKKLLILSVIILCSLSDIYAQTNIKLSNRVSFYSSYSDITINKETDTTIINKDGIHVEKQYFQLNAPVSSIQNIGLIENNLISLYEIESKPESDESRVVNSKDMDTLFFVLDQVYHDNVTRLMLNRETSIGIEQPTWDSDTHVYKVLEPCILNIISILMPPWSTSELNLIFKENYEFTGKDTIFLSASDAIHDLIWVPVDINGGPLSTQGYVKNKFDIFLPLAMGGHAHVIYSWFPSCTYKISDYHGTLPMIFGNISENFNSNNSNYLIEYPYQDSIVDNITFTNDPQEFVMIL